MRSCALLVFVVLACDPAPTTTPPTTNSSPPVATAAPTPAPLPEPTGDRLTLERTGCYGNCPVYTLHLYADGQVVWHGRAQVSRVATLRTRIDPAKVAELFAAAERLDFARLPRGPETAGCGTDFPGEALEIRRGDTIRTAFVDASCTFSRCEGKPGCTDTKPAILARRGLSLEAMVELSRLAQRIDEAVPTAGWIDDPDCRDILHETIAAGPFDPDPDDPATRLREAAYARLAARARRGLVVRITGLASATFNAEAEHHRRALGRLGVPADHVGLDAFDNPTGMAHETLELSVGPRKCFGETFPEPR
jgi:hypothetical protein